MSGHHMNKSFVRITFHQNNVSGSLVTSYGTVSVFVITHFLGASEVVLEVIAQNRKVRMPLVLGRLHTPCAYKPDAARSIDR